MERRKFIKTGCNACILLGSGLLIASLDSCTPKLSVSKVMQHDLKFAIPETEMATVSSKLITIRNFDYDVFLEKKKDSSYIALAMICTHAGHSLVKAGNTFYCSLHGSEFDMNGDVIKGPAERNLASLPVKVVNGQIEVTLIISTEIV